MKWISLTVVGLDNGIAKLGSRVDAELELGPLAIVGGQFLKDEGAEARSSSTAEGVEDEEALETGAALSETTNLIHCGVDQPNNALRQPVGQNYIGRDRNDHSLLANGVVTTSI